MNKKIPKYALINNCEAVLAETLRHATTGQIVCVFEVNGGDRCFVTEAEWLTGAKLFSQHAAEMHIVTTESSNADKLALFRSLFRGRENIYAHGYTQKDGSIGYSPACANERTGRCPRWTKTNPRLKCADCSNRTLIPLSNQALTNHFIGKSNEFRDVIGLYVLTQDCMTWMLVADFDKEGWQRETELYRDACRRFGLVPAVERSRSGNGAHVWLFFEEPIDAELARNLGFTLITHAMSQAAGMSFKSYDRLFPTQWVDVATFQSLTEKDDLGVPRAKPIVAEYGLVICDECHYGAAPNLELVMKTVNATRVYGLSATPKRSDGLENIVFMQCGPIRHKVDPREQAAAQSFRRVLLPRFTRVRIASLEPGSTFNQVVDSLCAHDARNRMMVGDAVDAVRRGRTPLVITKRKEHAAVLASGLSDAGIETFVLTGDGTTREKRERIERVRNAAGRRYALVATGSYIGEGFDLPQLDTLLLASPYSWEGVITQYSGRLHRESEGKNDVVVYDYVDTTVPMLERMYKKRLKTYTKLGYEIAEESEAEGPGARIIGAEGWHDEFVLDLSQANREVFVSVPYANPKLTESLLPDIANAIARGVKIRVIIRKPKSEKSLVLQTDIAETLTSAGCQVTLCDAPLTGIVIFDDGVSWYGTLPLLANGKPDDCSLRIEGAEVASDLARALEDSVVGEA